jgi:hypothetical protein
MSNEMKKPSVNRRVPTSIIAAMWIFAIGAPALVLHFQSVQAARRESEERVLTEVGAAINSPSHRSEVILARLAVTQNATNDVRYVRACRRLGFPTDWLTLFARLAREDKNMQANAARIIAEECKMDPGTTLKSEDGVLTLEPLRLDHGPLNTRPGQ